MKKFILLSFVFLGWAFYEMSDGADFEPASAQLSAVPDVTTSEVANAAAPAPEPAAPAPIAVSVSNTSAATAQAAATADDTDTPTRVSLNLTTLSSAEAAENDGVPITDPTLTDSASTPAIIPSLIVPGEGAAVQNAALSSSGGRDLREVTGNRVNVRGGPGTSFGIVSRLTRGDAVEVVQDNGDGWVLMRPMLGGPEGWMADFLLTAN
ncbi:MAG: SH3 domain-containing protein [Sulfitobacter sp.]